MGPRVQHASPHMGLSRLYPLPSTHVNRPLRSLPRRGPISPDIDHILMGHAGRVPKQVHCCCILTRTDEYECDQPALEFRGTGVGAALAIEGELQADAFHLRAGSWQRSGGRGRTHRRCWSRRARLTFCLGWHLEVWQDLAALKSELGDHDPERVLQPFCDPPAVAPDVGRFPAKEAHPTRAYLVSWIPRILSRRNSGSRNP